MRGTTGGEDVAPLQQGALFSTVHGAGRVMSRTQAAGRRNRKTGRQLSRGAVSPEMMRAWVLEKGVILRGGGLDESPHVYRRLPEVLTAQKGTIEVRHTLRPLIVVMAGAAGGLGSENGPSDNLDAPNVSYRLPIRSRSLFGVAIARRDFFWNASRT